MNPGCRPRRVSHISNWRYCWFCSKGFSCCFNGKYQKTSFGFFSRLKRGWLHLGHRMRLLVCRNTWLLQPTHPFNCKTVAPSVAPSCKKGSTVCIIVSNVLWLQPHFLCACLSAAHTTSLSRLRRLALGLHDIVVKQFFFQIAHPGVESNTVEFIKKKH